jgi:hypothetical protein
MCLQESQSLNKRSKQSCLEIDTSTHSTTQKTHSEKQNKPNKIRRKIRKPHSLPQTLEIAKQQQTIVMMELVGRKKKNSPAGRRSEPCFEVSIEEVSEGRDRNPGAKQVQQEHDELGSSTTTTTTTTTGTHDDGTHQQPSSKHMPAVHKSANFTSNSSRRSKLKLLIHASSHNSAQKFDCNARLLRQGFVGLRACGRAR